MILFYARTAWGSDRVDSGPPTESFGVQIVQMLSGAARDASPGSPEAALDIREGRARSVRKDVLLDIITNDHAQDAQNIKECSRTRHVPVRFHLFALDQKYKDRIRGAGGLL